MGRGCRMAQPVGPPRANPGNQQLTPAAGPLIYTANPPLKMRRKMKYGARNQLIAKVTSVTKGDVMALAKFEVKAPAAMVNTL